MVFINCNCKSSCTVAAVVASLIVGVVAAFFQITAVITVTPVFLWVVFGIAVVYLGVLVAAAASAGRTEQSDCVCPALNALLAGILGTVLFAVVLLAVGVVAASVVSAILIGLLLFFFALTLTSSACFVRCLFLCES